MTEDAVVARVRTILDYNKTSSELDGLDVMGGLDLDTIIKDSIPGALQQLVMVAPIEMLEVKTESYSAPSDTINGVPVLKPLSLPYSCVLPDDFLRFVAINTLDWLIPVTTLTEAGSKEHQKQYGEFSGLKATTVNPIAVMVPNSENKMSIIVYGGDQTSGVTLHYIGKSEVYEDEIEIRTQLQEPLCYIVASLVCEVLKDTNKSQMLMQTAQSLMVTAEAIGQNINNTNTEE